MIEPDPDPETEPGSAPHVLELGYTRAMMASLLFQAWPARTAMVGLGGGNACFDAAFLI